MHHTLTHPCPIIECPGIVAEVCASDNTTYINNCFLQKEACKLPKLPITVKAIGHCKHQFDRVPFAGPVNDVKGDDNDDDKKDNREGLQGNGS